jgi:hypothetical protein
MKYFLYSFWDKVKILQEILVLMFVIKQEGKNISKPKIAFKKS